MEQIRLSLHSIRDEEQRNLLATILHFPQVIKFLSIMESTQENQPTPGVYGIQSLFLILLVIRIPNGRLGVSVGTVEVLILPVKHSPIPLRQVELSGKEQ